MYAKWTNDKEVPKSGTDHLEYVWTVVKLTCASSSQNIDIYLKIVALSEFQLKKEYNCNIKDSTIFNFEDYYLEEGTTKFHMVNKDNKLVIYKTDGSKYYIIDIPDEISNHFNNGVPLKNFYKNKDNKAAFAISIINDNVVKTGGTRSLMSLIHIGGGGKSYDTVKNVFELFGTMSTATPAKTASTSPASQPPSQPQPQSQPQEHKFRNISININTPITQYTHDPQKTETENIQNFIHYIYTSIKQRNIDYVSKCKAMNKSVRNISSAYIVLCYVLHKRYPKKSYTHTINASDHMRLSKCNEIQFGRMQQAINTTNYHI